MCVCRLLFKEHRRTSSIAYSSDAIYLYSTRDDPEPMSMASRQSSILSPNKRTKLPSPGAANSQQPAAEGSDRDAMMEEDIERIFAEESQSEGEGEELEPLLARAMEEDALDIRPEDEEDDEEEEYEDDVYEGGQGDVRYDNVPTIMPRSQFKGVCNVETVKDGTSQCSSDACP